MDVRRITVAAVPAKTQSLTAYDPITDLDTDACDAEVEVRAVLIFGMSDDHRIPRWRQRVDFSGTIVRHAIDHNHHRPIGWSKNFLVVRVIVFISIAAVTLYVSRRVTLGE